MDDSSFNSMAQEIAGLLGIDRSKCARYDFSTNAVHGYSCNEDPLGAVSYPIYQSATFAHPALYESTGFAYSRCGNPTVLELENTMAALEGGLKAVAFSSGLAAISCILKLFSTDQRILVEEDLYGGTYRLFSDVYARNYNLDVIYADLSNLDAVEQICEQGVEAVFLETPTNPHMKVLDIETIARIAHEHDALLIVDNTFLTCYYQRPLELGADIVIYSGTKYLCGHNDCTCGFAIVDNDELLERVFMAYMSEGAALAPFEAWLMLRSLKTLSLRMDKQQENAQAIWTFLKQHPNVCSVIYNGDPDHPHHELMQRQASGFGAMISFETDTAERAVETLRKVNLIAFAESLGGCESLITYPTVQTHGAIPQSMRERLGVTDRLLRLSVGIENAADLIADLDHALS